MWLSLERALGRMKTVLETIQAGSGFLEKRGIESARLNMEYLLAHVLGCRRLDLYMEFDRPLEEDVLEPMRDLVKRRGNGVPLQHLTGNVEFCGRIFSCDSRALIPRPETEQLVEIAAEEARQLAPPVRVLDVGAGTGIIGLSLAAELGEIASSVTLVDVSPDALAAPGFVVMEIGAGQEDELLGSLKEIGLSDCKCVEDFAGIGRYLLAWRRE